MRYHLPTAPPPAFDPVRAVVAMLVMLAVAAGHSAAGAGSGAGPI